jgi:hypothetical protein
MSRQLCERCGLSPHIPHSDAEDCIRSLRVALERAECLAVKRGVMLARSEKRAEGWRAKTEAARGQSAKQKLDVCGCYKGGHEERLTRLEDLVERLFSGRKAA